ncbi:hypothetical protein PIB30_046592 [Stylosanthes scabra]|uniref:F-box associated beta-propeller type 1 domain-containing protein n=1 Tax=Stylosanthes scabra TaxID=79078 RepID=A0ABU6QG81_9FABA|nr:hypothetical protein [Stylosanthes scabra]
MQSNNKYSAVADLTEILFSIRTLIEDLREHAMRIKRIPRLDTDALWTIFANSEPRVAAQCRILSKNWERVLTSVDFIMENFKATKNRKMSIIVGVGYPPASLKSHWFIRFDAFTGEKIPFEVPFHINVFGHYAMIGSDHGNLSIRVTENGVHSRLLVWNPLTDKKAWVEDEAWKRRTYAVCLDSFSYLSDNMDYCILHAWKRQYWHRPLVWSLFKSEHKSWSSKGVFQTSEHKIGPYSIVADDAVFFIGWEGVNLADPKLILSYSFKEEDFYESNIPPDVIAENNALVKLKDGVGFINYTEVAFSRKVVVWQIHREGHDILLWEKMFTVRGFAFPFSPSILVDTSIISILECKHSFGPANNNERTDLYISKGRDNNKLMDMIYHSHWDENVQVKIVTLHAEGLYPV